METFVRCRVVCLECSQSVHGWLFQQLLSSYGLCCTMLRVGFTSDVKKVAHTRLPSVGFQSWSWFLAVSLQVTWVINPTVGCHYFSSGLQLPPATLKRAATNFAALWTEARWVWTVCLRLLPDSPSAPESSTLTTRLPGHPTSDVLK